MEIEYFPCYHSYLNKIAKLSDQEVGRLFRALLSYSSTGEAPELTGRESIAFDFIADDIDRAQESYKAKCKQNSINRQRNVIDRKQPSTDVIDRKRPSTDVPKTKDKDKTKDEEIQGDIPPVIPPAGVLPSPAAAFDRFWAAYPKKVGKGAARKSFAKVKVPLEQILAAVERQKRSDQWTRENGRYIPNPATWLNQCRWEDDLSPCVQSGENQKRPKSWAEIARQIESGDVT